MPRTVARARPCLLAGPSPEVIVGPPINGAEVDQKLGHEAEGERNHQETPRRVKISNGLGGSVSYGSCRSTPRRGGSRCLAALTRADEKLRIETRLHVLTRRKTWAWRRKRSRGNQALGYKKSISVGATAAPVLNCAALVGALYACRNPTHPGVSPRWDRPRPRARSRTIAKGGLAEVFRWESKPAHNARGSKSNSDLPPAEYWASRNHCVLNPFRSGGVTRGPPIRAIQDKGAGF